MQKQLRRKMMLKVYLSGLLSRRKQRTETEKEEKEQERVKKQKTETQ